MTNELDPQLQTVDQLFDDSGATYTIPVYQRNFAWQAEQIEQLISDIQGAISDERKGNEEDSYFLGNLIVTRRGTGRNPTRPNFEVIDGQQRLTTLHLLLTFLSGHGTKSSSKHEDQLLYESRPRATEALRRIKTESSRSTPMDTDLPDDEDTAIRLGYKIIEQYMGANIKDGARDKFADFLRDRVTLVLATLPTTTDLNRYFEIMNTRGQQLQQVDIVKARLMRHLNDNAQRACFAWVWDACADMDSYVQMSLTQGKPKLRSKVFGEDWSWLQARDFTDLMTHHRERTADATSDASGANANTAAFLEVTSLTLDEALARYEASEAPSTDEDPANERFKPTIEFPALLLQVLKVIRGEETEAEGQLDDRTLIEEFAKFFKAPQEECVEDDNPPAETVEDNEHLAELVQDFAFQLLRLRNLFDAFILKRQYTATSGDDGDWSLRRLIKRTSVKGPTPDYVNTFSANSTTDDDSAPDNATGNALLIESMLRVTYTSPRTMHWITKLLKRLTEDRPSQVSEQQIVTLLQDYSRGKVKQAFFDSEEPQGFDISRIVFTYLDYLLLLPKNRQPNQPPSPGFRFAFRNSIEHFYPQYAALPNSTDDVSKQHVNLLGNLALVSAGANSQLSNDLPVQKARRFKDTIATQSPKLRIMAAITLATGWRDEEVLAHHNAMVNLLADDLGVEAARRGQQGGAELATTD